MKKLIVILIAVIIIVAGIYLVLSKDRDDDSTNLTQQTSTTTTNESTPTNFINPKKGAHFETSTPAHASTLAAAPAEVVLDFNFDLADNSTISINKDGRDYGSGATRFDSNKLTMRRQMLLDAPDGVYKVNYNGCWPDRSCHDGHFQFAINHGLLSTFEDKRGQKELTIKMSQIKFQPMNLRISQNTKVTWVNDDETPHYVNTDSHPAHTHEPRLNSRAIEQRQSYSYTFTTAGAFPYHCSAHAANMNGNIVVEAS